jgi:fumarate reductase subunit C
MIITRKYLCYTVGWHLVCRLLLYVEAILLDLLADPVLVDINVLKLSAKLIHLFCNYAYRLLVVTLDNRRLVKL